MRKTLISLWLLLATINVTGCIQPITAPTTLLPDATPTALPQAASAAPHFGTSTTIDNPLLPVSDYTQTITLGTEEGKPDRVETTRLPEPKMIEFNGQQVEATVLQVLDCIDTDVAEIAYEYYAQADDGGVYFLGEAVDNYEEGQVVDQEGSWLAGQNGALPILIMLADPVIGLLFSAPGDTTAPIHRIEIVALDQQANTPDGATTQGVQVKTTLSDGSVDSLTYVTDFGLVASQNDEETLQLVLALPSDAPTGTIPRPLNTIEAQAEDLIDILPGGNWTAISQNVADIAAAWQAYQPQLTTDHVPQPFETAFNDALAQLQQSANAQAADETHQAANDVSAALMDLFALYQPATPVDLGRLDVLGRQAILDVAAEDFVAAANTLAKTRAIWNRLKPDVLAHDGSQVASEVEDSLDIQQVALEAEDGEALRDEANNGLELVDALEQLY